MDKHLIEEGEGEAPTRLAIGLRVHVENCPKLHDFYLTNFRNWLNFRKYKLINYTAGIHLNTANPHIHIHFIAEGKKLSAPIDTLKRDFNKRLGTQFPLETFEERAKWGCPLNMVSEKYKGKINMSLQIKDLEEHNIDRFLQYPLKEGRLISSDLPLVKLNALMEVAQTEYQNSLAKQANHERKEKEKESEWEKMCETIDQQEPTTLRQVFRELIEYYREWNKPPTMKFIYDTAERYAFKKRIIDVDYLMRKFNLDEYNF